MLLGTYPARFASGHRIAVPAQFRAYLGETYVLAKWYEECLVLFDGESWLALYKRLVGEEKTIIGSIRDTERFILGSAYEAEADNQGRIVVPERLATYAHFGEEIYFIGLGDRVEIWDKNIWEEKEKSVAKDAAKYIEELSKNEKR